MTAGGGPAADGVFPTDGIRRILILRTAQLAELQWARAELARRYPDATVGVLGTKLATLPAFRDCIQFEVAADWLTPRSVRPLRPALRAFAPDLVVMCLNINGRTGYGRVSRIVRSLRAPHTIVADYTRHWFPWSHADFVRGPRTTLWLRAAAQWLTGVAGMALLTPVVAAYLLAKPATPIYLATPPHRPRKRERA